LAEDDDAEQAREAALDLEQALEVAERRRGGGVGLVEGEADAAAGLVRGNQQPAHLLGAGLRALTDAGGLVQRVDDGLLHVPDAHDLAAALGGLHAGDGGANQGDGLAGGGDAVFQRIQDGGLP